MHALKLLLLLLLLLSLVGCNSRDSFGSKAGGTVYLDRTNDSLYTIKHAINDTVVSAWELRYPVYQFDYGDLDGDGENEICVGVIKTTKYDTVSRKRLFIFRLFDGRLIRPRWLGSRVGFQLENFYVCRDSQPAVVITTEIKHDSTVCLQYHLGGFGLQFDKYLEQ